MKSSILGIAFCLLFLCSSTVSKKFKGNRSDFTDLDGELKNFVSSEEYAAVLFYDRQNVKSSKCLNRLEKSEIQSLLPVGKIDNDEEALAYGLKIGQLPRLVLFENGVPEEYPGSPDDAKEVVKWIEDEINSNEIEIIDAETLEKVVDTGNAVLALFMREDTDSFPGESNIQSACEKFDVNVVKIQNEEAASNKYGIDEFPAVLYFERGIPTIYEDSVRSEETLMEWLETQRNSDTVEEVSDEILQALIVDQEYLAVFFTGPCDERATTDQECERVLKELENIDDELDSYGITLVTTEDIVFAGNVLKIRKFPALGIFRNGEFLLHKGSLQDERELLNWLLDKETLEIPGKIEEVGRTMLMKLVEEEPDMIVFIYDNDSAEKRRKADAILKTLEIVDDKLEKHAIEFVKCSDDNIAEDFGFFEDTPMLLYFENEIPLSFDGDNLNDEREIYKWALEQFETNEIPMVDLPVLEKITERIDKLLVIFYDPNKRRHNAFLEDVENADDDAEKMAIFMVKVSDTSIAKSFGIYTLPALLYYENGIPNLYDEDLNSEVVLRWLENERSTSSIEKVTGLLLEKLIKEEEYVAVLALSDCEKNEEECEATIQELENIDEDLDKLDIHLVYTEDTQYVISKLRINSFPSVIYFRNGNKIIFDGSVSNEVAVFKFLTGLNNIILPGVIEEVGVKLLHHLSSIKDHVFAFMYDENNKRSLRILEILEKFVDKSMETEEALFVKCSDENAEDEFGIGYLPRLIHFNRRIPEAFEGDETNEEAVLQWMRDEITEKRIVSVTKSVLEKLIEREDHIGVFFVDDENKEEMAIITEIEKYYDKIVEDDLELVMIDDKEWSEELGLEDPPTLIHFSGVIPCVYRGEENPREIVNWLGKMKTEFVIEEVTDKILEDLIEEEEYVAVFFKGGSGCESLKCREMSRVLETIDDDLHSIGIAFVQLENEEYPSQAHGISVFPSLGLYRNGDYKPIDEELLQDEMEIKKWFLNLENLRLIDSIETVNSDMLAYIYENNDNFVVLFYDEDDRNSDDIIEKLERIDSRLNDMNIVFVKIKDEGAEESYGILDTPTVAYIRDGIPNIYQDTLDNEDEVLSWIETESKTTRILDVTDVLFAKLLDKFKNIAVVFYDMEEDPTVDILQSIANDCRDNSIAIVKLNDQEEFEKFGLLSQEMPQIVFFREKVPSLMTSANIEKPKEVMEWILKQKTTSVIEEVTDEMLEYLVEHHEYVAVYFTGVSSKDPAEGKDCESVIAKLETIDDDLDSTGILIVTTAEMRIATENGVKEFPKVGLFRNGHFIAYEGEETNEKALLKWFTNEETLKIIGIIDDVNLAMLDNILDEEEYAFVFFYESNDTDAHTILEELEEIDEKLDQQDLTFVKISDPGSAWAFGIAQIPVLVFFENGVPEIYTGNLLNEKNIMKWMKTSLHERSIKEVSKEMLKVLVEKEKNIAVLFYNPDANEDYLIISKMEKIEKNCKKYGIDLLKIQDTREAKKYGIEELPGLLYFEKRIPSLYDEVLEDENVLFEWLVTQKMTDTIEEVTEEILESLIQEEEYLSVFFSGPCDENNDEDQCNVILSELEKIDTTLGEQGIMLVTTEGRDLAKQYEIRSFPSIVLFKNGECVPFEGDINEELEILDWLTDKNTMTISGKIEKINSNSLGYLLDTEAHVMVLLYREGNLQDEQLLEKLEKIDDDLEEQKINLVRCSEKGIEKKFGLNGFPLLVHFHDRVPNVFTDRGAKPEVMLEWMLESMKRQEIEEVNAPILDALREELDHLVVIFTDDESGEFLEGMEQMDDELDSICVPMVKINDDGKALEFGIEAFPTLVYFKKKIPGLYDGDVKNFNNIFSWISSRKKENLIQLVSDSILKDIVQDSEFPYVAVLFQGSCKDTECTSNLENIISGIETINDEVESLGITLITTKEKRAAKLEYGVTNFPAIVFFRNGLEDQLLYPGDMTDNARILSWLSDTENYEIQGKIERVNGELLEHIVDSEDDVLVYFYNEKDSNLDSDGALEVLEKIDDALESDGVEFIMIPEDEEDVIEKYGLNLVPSLVYFDCGIPTVYSGDLNNADSILGWITKALREQSIIEVNDLVLDSLIERNTYVAAVYYSKNHALDNTVLQELEEIDGDLKDNDINMVKISNPKSFNALGIPDYSPIFVYYENGIPSLYSKPLDKNIRDVFHWLVEQRNIASIEFVSDAMLENVIRDEEYVAVLFMGTCAEDEEEEECRKILTDLERIDHLLDEFGIIFVATNYTEKAKEHWISRFPALAIYRNGDYLKYNGGDLSAEREVLKWLTSDKTLSIPGQIEKVNDIMLNKLLRRKGANAFVFFYDEEDVFAQRILKGLEDLDSELESEDIDFFKISDEGIEEEYDLEHLPSLVHFKGGESREFFGDIRQLHLIFQWISEESVDKNKPKLKKKGPSKKKKAL